MRKIIAGLVLCAGSVLFGATGNSALAGQHGKVPAIKSVHKNTVKMLATTIEVGVVKRNSPAVSLREVGKMVRPGLFVIDPRRIKGKRLILHWQDVGPEAKKISIAVWNGQKEQCIGIYIEKDDK